MRGSGVSGTGLECGNGVEELTVWRFYLGFGFMIYRYRVLP